MCYNADAPRPLVPLRWSRGSVGPSGQCFSSSIMSAGSSDDGGEFLVSASLPGWLRDALRVLAAVGWWRCMPGPLRAPGFAVSGCSCGSASPLPPSRVPLHCLRAPRCCARTPSLAPAFVSHLGAVCVLAGVVGSVRVAYVFMVSVAVLAAHRLADWVWSTLLSPPAPVLPSSLTPSPAQCLTLSSGGMSGGSRELSAGVIGSACSWWVVVVSAVFSWTCRHAVWSL